MSIKGIVPGRAYRAYRFPARTGGRLSRRVSAVRPVGTFAGVLGAVLLAGAAFVGFTVIATLGYFASDLPAAHDLSRRVSAVRPVGTFAGVLGAVLLAGAAFVGFTVIATLGYFASDLPAAHD